MGINIWKHGSAVRLANLSSAPSSPSAGTLYWDTSDSNFKFHNGSSFLNVADKTNSIQRDGSVTFTANQPMGGFKLTGLAAGSSAGDSVRYEQAILVSGANAFAANQPMGGFKLTGLAAGSTAGDSVRYEQVILRDGSQAFSADQSMGGFKLTNLADPVSAQDAATKNYVDSLANGLSWKDSVVVATTANITLSGEQTIDGVLTSSSRVLVKNQTASEDNGIYVSASGAWSRAADMDAWSEVPSAAVFVEQGTANADTAWVCTSDSGGTLGVTAITFAQFSSATSLTGGNGIDISGNIVSVDHDGEGLTFSGVQLALELDGSTLSKSASGVKVADAGITGTQLAASVAGAGLAGGAGSALSVNVDGSTIEIATDTLQVVDAGISTAKLADNSVTDTKLRDSAALSVIGRASNSSGDPADIAASVDGQVLRRSGVTLGFGLLTNANIDAAAAIAYSKLDLSGSIVNADINASAAIDATKIHDGSVDNTEFGYLNGVTSGIQGQIDGKLSTALTDGSIFIGNVSNVATAQTVSGDISISNTGVVAISSGVIVDADINASAAISLSKLASLTASRALVSDGSGVISVSAVTSTELGYLSGVTSAIQTQLDGKVDGPASATDNALARFDGTTGKLVQDSNATLSDTGALTIQDTFSRGDSSSTNVVEQEYIHNQSLTASTTAVLAALTFNGQNFKAVQIEYMVRNGNDRRSGKMYVVCDNASGVSPSNVAFDDQFLETADLGLSWSAAINGTNIEISYTTGAGTFSINADVKRFKP